MNYYIFNVANFSELNKAKTAVVTYVNLGMCQPPQASYKQIQGLRLADGRKQNGKKENYRLT